MNCRVCADKSCVLPEAVAAGRGLTVILPEGVPIHFSLIGSRKAFGRHADCPLEMTVLG